MSLLRPFSALDLLRFNSINLDAWTETYSISYYLHQLATWPDMFSVVESADSKLMGYGGYPFALRLGVYDTIWFLADHLNRVGTVIGKTEGPGKDWHGHVTAITVSPQYRRIGLAKAMMNLLEKSSDVNKAWFVDLYVRVSNDVAIDMYESMGYEVYRRVRDYYSGGVRAQEEDAFDMRKPCAVDKDRSSLAGGGRQKIVDPEDCWP